MKSQKGFTLIELIVVIVILGILGAIALPKFTNIAGDARASVMRGVAGSMAAANALVYARASIAGQTGATGTVTVNGVSVSTVYGFASTAGQLAQVMELNPIADFTVSPLATSPGTIQHARAASTANCIVTYGVATGAPATGLTTSPTYALVVTGC